MLLVTRRVVFTEGASPRRRFGHPPSPTAVPCGSVCCPGFSATLPGLVSARSRRRGPGWIRRAAPGPASLPVSERGLSPGPWSWKESVVEPGRWEEPTPAAEINWLTRPRGSRWGGPEGAAWKGRLSLGGAQRTAAFPCCVVGMATMGL